MSPAATDRLSVVFGALADPTRRAILARLAQGEATVGQLAEPLRAAAGWVDRYRTFWEGGLDRLDAHLQRLMTGDGQPGND
jgi:DNA-binding transcriptional ArsR family regulator